MLQLHKVQQDNQASARRMRARRHTIVETATIGYGQASKLSAEKSATEPEQEHTARQPRIRSPSIAPLGGQRVNSMRVTGKVAQLCAATHPGRGRGQPTPHR